MIWDFKLMALRLHIVQTKSTGFLKEDARRWSIHFSLEEILQGVKDLAKMTLVMNESYADRRLPHHRNPKEFVPLDHLADLEWCEGESGSKFSSPVTESNSQDSSLIALKLGRLADSKNGQNGQHSKERSTRAGIKGSYSHTPTRQVLGCNMDLSSSKDYHERHIVCDTHSKTPKAIVNGIEVNVTPSEEKTVDEEPLVYANKQEAKNAFKALLESANVHSDWTWKQVAWLFHSYYHHLLLLKSLITVFEMLYQTIVR